MVQVGPLLKTKPYRNVGLFYCYYLNILEKLLKAYLQLISKYLKEQAKFTKIDRYLTGGPDWRAKNPCIGDSRKDFIMSGAAILRSILRVWPTNTLTVADRGLREGILYSQMVKQGYLR